MKKSNIAHQWDGSQGHQLRLIRQYYDVIVHHNKKEMTRYILEAEGVDSIGDVAWKKIQEWTVSGTVSEGATPPFNDFIEEMMRILDEVETLRQEVDELRECSES